MPPLRNVSHVRVVQHSQLRPFAPAPFSPGLPKRVAARVPLSQSEAISSSERFSSMLAAALSAFFSRPSSSIRWMTAMSLVLEQEVRGKRSEVRGQRSEVSSNR